MIDFSEPTSPADSSSSISPKPVASCWISFGGNVGDVKASFDAALALLSLHPNIALSQQSGIYSTSPMGAQAGSPFLNSICGLKTQLSPRELLKVLQSVETQLGRIHDIRWGPRTLDLDLISYGDQVICEPDLIVPHPAMAYRRFVLDPLVEVDPDWRHPICLETASRLRERLNARPLKVRLIDTPPEQIQTLTCQLASRFPALQLFTDSPNNDDSLLVGSGPSARPCGIDLRHTPGDLLEQLTSAFTAIFDRPERICDW